MARGTTALGKFRGKMGGQVFRVVKGQQVMQEYNPNPAKSSTAPQVLQRNAMTMLSKMGSAILDAVRVGFGREKYPYSEFIKSNLRPGVFTTSGTSEVTPHYGLMKISQKTIGGNTLLRVSTVDYGTVEHLNVGISFNLMSDYPVEDFDVYGVVFSPDLNLAVINKAGGSGSKVTVTVPSIFDGLDVHVWAFAAGQPSGIDPEAIDQTHERLPILTTESTYCGTGEVE